MEWTWGAEFLEGQGNTQLLKKKVSFNDFLILGKTIIQFNCPKKVKLSEYQEDPDKIKKKNSDCSKKNSLEVLNNITDELSEFYINVSPNINKALISESNFVSNFVSNYLEQFQSYLDSLTTVLWVY